MPVLPAVPSTMRPPLRSTPRRSASSTMARAARSFTEPLGFMNSALPRIVQPVVSEALRSRMRGVLPMAAETSPHAWSAPRLRTALPAMDLVVAREEHRELRTRDRHESVQELGGVDPSLLRVLLDVVAGAAFCEELREIAGEVRRVLLAAAPEAQRRDLLGAHAVGDGAPVQEQVELGSRAAQGVAQPHDGVVLLLQGRPIRVLHDVKLSLAHDALPQSLVGTTSVLFESSMKRARSAGDPRRVPAAPPSTPPPAPPPAPVA